MVMAAIYLYIALGQGQTTHWGQMSSLTHLVSQLSHLLHVSPINDFVTVFPHLNIMATQFDFAVNRSRSTQGHHLYKLCLARVTDATCQVSRS